MKTLVVILGPTAVGKTSLSIELAKHLQCDIFSADSRQMYQQLSIGTAKPTEEEMQHVRHHFIDFLPVTSYYSAALYEQDAIRALESYFNTHDVAIMVGGSMLYVDAVCHGIDEIPTIRQEIRHQVYEDFHQKGLSVLLAELQERDPEYYEIVDKNNHKRVIHAIEICRQTGSPFSKLRTSVRKKREFRILKIGLTRNRESLFARINARVDIMMAEGLLNEVRGLVNFKAHNALNTVGYKELFHVLDNTWALPMAIDRIKKNTRVYAKKQLTWYKKDTSISWFNLDDETPAQVLQHIKGLL
jgi:tRNA dimethylallyltransferase